MRKVCDVIFGHFLIIGLLLMGGSCIAWAFMLPVPHEQAGYIGAFLTMGALLYAQTGGDDDGG